jgi:hypothetical protein
LGQPDAQRLADPGLGHPIATSRSSWVRHIESAASGYFIKVYNYQSLAGRLRGIRRNTGPCTQSRALREARALLWLAKQGFPAPRPVVVLEARRWKLLTKAVLVTVAWPGQRLDRLLPELPSVRRQQLAQDLGRFVAEMHRRGFRDRNLDLRNLLARERPDQTFELAKIDSGRYRILAPGRGEDALARADWDRLLPQLEPFGLASVVRHAARGADLSGRAT